jgi:diguanylate cyclase (GGDEF)-like protein
LDSKLQRSAAGQVSKHAQILMVEDDAVIRHMLSQLLRNSGWLVDEAADGLEALDAAQHRRPDLVLLDIGLPGIDGFEVCRRLRARTEFEEVPILMLTGRDDVDSIRAAFEAGASDFAIKTIAPSLIAHRVRFMLRASMTLTALRRSEARLAEAQRIARMGNWELDVRSGAFIASGETLRLLRLGAEAGVRPLSMIRMSIAEDEREQFDQMLTAAQSTASGRFDREFRVVTGGGHSRVIRFIGEADATSGVTVERLMGTAQDLTEVVESREQIRTLAYYDSLTGLPNRLLFLDQVRVAMTRARRRGDKTALMVVDLDNFKRINDTLGHGAGDEVLRIVGQRLRDAIRDTDGVLRDDETPAAPSVARMGGDEFLIAASDMATGEQAAAVATRLLDALRAPIPLSSGPVYISASLGISIFPDDGNEFETLLKHADVALYQAKDAGRNTFEFYNQQMNELALQRLVLESSLRDAIAERSLSLAVQPKVDGRTGEVIGGEALLRWHHGDHGVVAPTVFVSLAERIGLASPLTIMIVDEVCQHMVAWREAGLSLLPIAVNVSAHVFRDQETVDTICRIPASYGISPDLIEFEVTETALIDDPRRAAGVLNLIRERGYRVALDDFGTGYSSLSHLRKFGLDVLKVDRSFVRDLQINAKDASIVRGIIAMAHSLGLETVAEGVESEAQREALLRFGCTTMQGFLFGTPGTAAEFAERLRARDQFSQPCAAASEPTALLAAE